MKTLLIASLTGILTFSAMQVAAHPGNHHGVKHLPAGAVSVVVSGIKYWLKDDVYYRKQNNVYVKVVAPKGATLVRVPKGAVLVKHKGQPYYRYNNVYYRWVPKARGYRVVSF